MAYIYTVDERYGGGSSSSYAGARDAPGALNTPYTLAEGLLNEAYGALIASNFRADLDVYAVGTLAPGRYTFRASGWNWDYSNNVWSTGLSEVLVYDAMGYVVASSFLGTVNLTVTTAGSYYVGVQGSSYTSTEYELYYRYEGPVAPVNAPAVFAGGLVGSVQAGQTIRLDVSVFDANGTRAYSAGAGVRFQWEVSNDGANWAPVQGVDTAGVVIGTADVGKYIRATVKFFDDAGFLESYTVTANARIAPPPDTTPPTLVSVLPGVGVANFAVDGNLVLRFSESIARGSGTLLLTDATGNTVESFSVASSGAISITGDTLVIDPAVVLQPGQTYRLSVPAGAIKDLAGNSFAGYGPHTFATTPPSNRAPVAGSVALTVAEDGRLDVQLPAASDPDGDVITYLLAAGPNRGSATVSPAGLLSYRPGADFNGSDAIQFSVRDARGASTTYDATITVTPVNDAPMVSSGRVELDEDRVASGRLPTAIDADGDTLTYTLLGSPSLGVATVERAGGFTFSPRANESGADTLKFRVSDPSGAFVDQTVELIVRSVTDEFLGTSANDTLPGFQGADIYRGGDGDDRLTGGGGNDELHGDRGVDVAVYAGQRSSFVLSRDGAAWLVDDPTGKEGRDRLVGVERLQFRDTSLAMDLDGHAGSVARVLRALLGSDSLKVAVYVGHGLRAADAGAGESELVAMAIAAAQLDGLSASDFARTLYRNVVGVEPDSPTLSTFVGMLDRGELTRQSLGLLAAQNDVNATSVELIGLQTTGIEFVWPA